MAQQKIDDAMAKGRNLLSTINEYMPTILCVGAVVFWGFGGVRPQSLVDNDSIRTQLNSFQDTQKTNFENLQKQIDKIFTRLETMPRPNDFADQQASLKALASQQAVDETAFAKLAVRVDQLDQRVPALPYQYRNPTSK